MRIVHKYGGSSVATPGQITAVAKHIVQLKREGWQIVVVASAMGKTTDRLIELASTVSDGKNKREMDALLSTGEQQTVSLLAMAIEAQGEQAVSMTGFQAGIITDDAHSEAFIKHLDLTRVERELDAGKVVVIAGFQGITENGDISTLGRGGSDTTAVAIAAKLGCDCEIYTDVEGVYTIDPRIYPKAKKIHNITYDEMLEMSAGGAKVLETRCVEKAKKYGVKLFLGKALEKDKEKGTYIGAKGESFEPSPIIGISVKSGVSVMSFKYSGSDEKTLELLLNKHIGLDMLSQSIYDGKTCFSLSCSDEMARGVSALLTDGKGDEKLELEMRSGLVKIKLTGAMVAAHSKAVSEILKALTDNKIPFYQFMTSEFSVIFATDSEYKETAIDILTHIYDL